uniref:DUF295 domain-containing protein n=1 Tax=Brassica campestris TaxID=3711 RepID=A0A3P5ZTZ4_BRACM|nr:unnamed protein product [Brassica rapa]
MCSISIYTMFITLALSPSGSLLKTVLQLKRGSIYTLTNFFASNSKVMYGVADQKLVICITHTSILSKLEENIEGIPSQCFRIHSFPDFEANCYLRGDLYDVVGYLKLVGRPGSPSTSRFTHQGWLNFTENYGPPAD